MGFQKSRVAEDEQLSVPLAEPDEPVVADFDNQINAPVDEIEDEKEHVLGTGDPLPTLLKQSVGPFVSQFTQALFGVMKTIWTRLALGQEGVSALSTMSNFDTVPRAFGFFLSAAGSAKMSALFGAGRTDEVPQVMSDMIRIALIFSVVVPAILCPTYRTVALWFGADGHIADWACDYSVPLSACAFCPILYMAFCGGLLAEGRTYLFAGLQLITMVLNIGLIDPILLLVAKVGIEANSIATILGEGLPMVVVAVLFYCGRFGVKLKLADLIRPFSKETWPALKVGLPTLLYQLSLALPRMALRKLIALSAPAGHYVPCIAGYNAQVRIYQAVMMVPAALALGLGLAGSYAFGANRLKRLLWLSFHAGWMSIVWCGLTMIATVAFPDELSKIFGSEAEYLTWAPKMIRNASVASVALAAVVVVPAFLQAQHRGIRGAIITFGTLLLPLPLFGIGLYYGFPDAKDATRILYAHPLQQGFGIILACVLGIVPLLHLLKAAKEEDKPAELEDPDFMDLGIIGED